MAKEPEGVVYSNKNPTPKPSPKSFRWPERSEANDEVRLKLAASLQELLPTKHWTHIDLAKYLFGHADAGHVRRIGATRAWLRGGGPFMTEDQAGWTAQALGVPMARLLEPKKAFDANSTLIRRKGPYKNAGKKKEPEEDDGRWTLPKGVKAPSFKQATLDDRPGWTAVELKATLPDDVSQAIFSMLKCKPASE